MAIPQIVSTRNGSGSITGFRDDLAQGDLIGLSLTNTVGITSVLWELIGRPEGSVAGGAGPEPVILPGGFTSAFTADTDAGDFRLDGTYNVQATLNPGSPGELRITTILCRLSGLSIPGPSSTIRTLRKLGGFEALEDTSIATIVQGWATELNRWLELVRETVTGGGPSDFTTIAGAYSHGASSSDQTMVMHDAKGGGLILDATQGDFTGASALRINTVAGGPLTVARATGALGIGTASPLKPIHIVNTTPALRLDRTGGAALDIANVGDELQFLNGATVLGKFEPTGGLRADLGVGIGTTPATNPVLSLGDGAGVAVSAAGTARFRYNSSNSHAEWSENGGPWTPFQAPFSAYQTIDANGTPLPQRSILNFSPDLAAVDNSGATRTDVSLVNAGAGAGSYGGSGISGLTLDAKGRVTAVTAATYPLTAYQTIDRAGTPATQRTTLNFSATFSVVDNGGASRTDVDLAANGVSSAQLRQSVAFSLVGNPTAATANVQDVAIGAGLGVSGTTLISTTVASWTITNVRWFAADATNGNDANAGFSDVSEADAGTKAVQTLARLFEIIPKGGAGRSAKVIIAAGTYTDGLPLNGLFGYNIFGIIGTSTQANAGAVAFDGSANTDLFAGAITVPGLNAAGYNPTGSPSTTSWSLQQLGGGAAALPAEPAPPLGWRVRFDINTSTVALRGLCKQISQVNSSSQLTINAASALPTPPSGADVFYIEKAGVIVGATTINTSQTVFLAIGGMDIAGVTILNGVASFIFSGTTTFNLQSPAGVQVQGIWQGNFPGANRRLGGGLVVSGNTNNAGIGGGRWASIQGITHVGTVEMLDPPGPFTIADGNTYAQGIVIHGSPMAVQGPDGVDAFGVFTGIGIPRIIGPGTYIGGTADLVLRGTNVSLRSFAMTGAGAHPVILAIGQNNIIFVNAVTGSTGNSDVGLDLTAAFNSKITIQTLPTVTGTAGDVRLSDGTIITWTQAASGVTDSAGNTIVASANPFPIQRKPTGTYLTDLSIGGFVQAAPGTGLLSTGPVPGASVRADGIVTGTLQLASIAAASLSDGTNAWVDSVGDFFVLAQSTLTPDNITIVTASGKAGYQWRRLNQSNRVWAARTGWWVDPANVSAAASDENTGASSSLPLATFAELGRRLKGATFTQTLVTVTLMSNGATTDPLILDGVKAGAVFPTLQIVGVPTVIASGRTISTPRNPAVTANDHFEITDATATFTPWIQKYLLHRTNGTPAYFWPYKDLGSGHLQISPPINPASVGAIQVLSNGDTYEVLQLPTFADVYMTGQSALLLVTISLVNNIGTAALGASFATPAGTGALTFDRVLLGGSFVSLGNAEGAVQLSLQNVCLPASAGGGAVQGPVSIWGGLFAGDGSTTALEFTEGYSLGGNASNFMTLGGCQFQVVHDGRFEKMAFMAYDFTSLWAAVTVTHLARAWITAIGGERNAGQLVATDSAGIVGSQNFAAWNAAATSSSTPYNVTGTLYTQAQLGIDTNRLATSFGGIFQMETGAWGGDLVGSGVNPVVGPHAITYGKIQQVAALSVLGNATGSLADVAAITATTNGQILQVASGALVWAPIFYQTVEQNGAALTQRGILNFTPRFAAADNAGAVRTDVDLAVSGVTAGSYSSANITVDAFGRVTVASNGGGVAFYQTIQNAGSSVPQRGVWNASTGLTAVDNGGAGRTDVTVNLSTGLSGGQSLYGGTAGGEGLHIISTFNATKGQIYLGAGTSDFYDEPTGGFSLGTTLSAGGLVKALVTSGKLALAISGTDFQPAGAYITALTGDVTATGPGSVAATIGANKVTYPKIQVESASTLLGNPTGSAANVQEIGLGTGLGFSGLGGGILVNTSPLSALTATSPLNISGTVISFPGAISYGGPGSQNLASLSSGLLLVTAGAGPGGGAGLSTVTAYQTVEQAGSALTQRSILNFTADFNAFDNIGSTRTDVQLANVGPGANTYGGTGISSITLDNRGRVVSLTTATYLSTMTSFATFQIGGFLSTLGSGNHWLGVGENDISNSAIEYPIGGILSQGSTNVNFNFNIGTMTGFAGGFTLSITMDGSVIFTTGTISTTGLYTTGLVSIVGGHTLGIRLQYGGGGAPTLDIRMTGVFT